MDSRYSDKSFSLRSFRDKLTLLPQHCVWDLDGEAFRDESALWWKRLMQTSVMPRRITSVFCLIQSFMRGLDCVDSVSCTDISGNCGRNLSAVTMLLTATKLTCRTGPGWLCSTDAHQDLIYLTSSSWFIYI